MIIQFLIEYITIYMRSDNRVEVLNQKYISESITYQYDTAMALLTGVNCYIEYTHISNLSQCK